MTQITKTRKSWRDYFFDVAKVVATRSTCPRLSVGALAVHKNRIIATGFNGSLPGHDHCDDVGCNVLDNHCTRVVHAEANVVAQLAQSNTRSDSVEVYVTHTPCRECMKLMKAAGITKIHWESSYGNPRYDF